MKRGLRIAALAAACAVPASGQPAALASLRDAVSARWEFQKRFPEAKLLFAGSLDGPGRQALIGRLRLQAVPSPDPRAGGPVSAEAAAAAWSAFASGLAQERQQAGSGGPEYAAAARLAAGDLGLPYEMARIADQAGMARRARAWQLETHRAMLEKGYLRVPEFAKPELWKARQARAEGRFQDARQSLDFAKRLDPLCPWVPIQNLALHAAERSVLSWDLGYLWLCLVESCRLLRYHEVQTLFLVNLSRWLRAGLGLFGAVGLLILFARHFTRVAHPWAERLPQAVEMRVRYLAVASCLLALAVGGLGFVALGLLGAMLLWKHCAREEKSVLAAVMFGIALVPVLLAWERTLCRHLDPGRGVGLYREAWARGYENPLAERAAALVPGDREDSLFRSLSLSVLYRKQGNYQRAGAYAAEVERAGPGPGIAALNKGNIAMSSFEYGKAAAAYALARRQAPDRVETWFNSSQAELYASNSAEHKKYLDKAAEIDAAWVTQWLKDNDENFPTYPATRKAMDPMLGMGQAWQSAWGSLAGLDFLRVGVRSGIARLPGAGVLALAFLAAAGLWLRFRRYSTHTHGRDLFECRICGRVMCRVCRKGVHCQRCFKTVSGVQENRMRVELVGRLRHRAALSAVRAGSALNALVPGVGRLYLGRGGARFLWPLAACLSVAALWSSGRMIMEYPVFAIGPLRWLPLVPLVAVYGIFNLRQLRAPLASADAVAAQAAFEKETAR